MKHCEYYCVIAIKIRKLLSSGLIQILIFACVVRLSHQLYENDANIVKLTDVNFDLKVTNSSEMWVVEFYSPNCRHCIALVPEFKKLAVKLKKKFPVGAVDCLREKILCSDYDIRSFPRIAFLYETYIIDFSGTTVSDRIAIAAENAHNDYREFSH